jgi:hypothetical protein
MGDWLAALSVIEGIGLLGGLASLIGLAITLRAFFRSRTRAGLLAKQLDASQSELRLEKNERMAAERRAEQAEAERDRASPEGMLAHIENLKTRQQFEEWEKHAELSS